MKWQATLSVQHYPRPVSFPNKYLAVEVVLGDQYVSLPSQPVLDKIPILGMSEHQIPLLVHLPVLSSII